MSNSEDDLDPSALLEASTDAILGRVAAISGAKNDSALARALGTSRQTISTWRKRGNIPYAAVALFAVQKDASLDYLLLGRGGERRYGGLIDPLLMEAVAMELWAQVQARGLKFYGADSPSFSYDCSIIYNRCVRLSKPGDNRYEFVPEEVGYLLDLTARERAPGGTVRVHPEIAHNLEGLGLPISEIYGNGKGRKVVVDAPIDSPARKPTTRRVKRTK